MFLGAGSIAMYFGVQTYRRSNALQDAKAAYAQGNWLAASEGLSRYLPHDPSNIELLTMYAEANAHIVEDRPSALRNVAHAFHQILRYEARDLKAQERLLSLYERQGAWEVLEYYASDWLRHDPESVVLLRARALSLDKGGSRDDAIAAYEDLFAHHPGDSREISRYAALIRERSNANTAEQFLTETLDQNPGNPVCLVAVAQYWLDTGDVETAKHFASLAVESAPDFLGHRLLRARIAASERRWDDALSLSELSSGDGSPDAELVSLRANLLLASGDAASAAELIASTSQAVRIDHPRLQILLIDSFYGLGRIADAREASGLYLQAYPLDTATRNYIDGRDALADDRYADAADLLSVAVEMRPEFRAARLAMTVAKFESGDYAAGRGVLEAYLRENPGDDRARSLWTHYVGMNLEEAERRARLSEGESESDANALLAAAELMTDEAVREGSLADRAQAISNLAHRAAKMSPGSAAPFQFLAGLWLRLGETDRARGVLVLATESKIDQRVLNKMKGMIALADRNVQIAWSVFESIADTLNDDELRGWARRFAVADAYAEAMRAFDVGEQNRTDAAFDLDRLALAAEFASLDEAWNALEAYQIPATPDLRRMNRVRLLLAVRYAESPDDSHSARLQQLAERSSESNDDPSALLIQALYAQYGEQPDLKIAKTFLLAAEHQSPNDPLVLDRFRSFYERADQLVNALNYAERASAAEPGNDLLRFELGRLQAARGLFQEAEKTMRDVLSRQPDSAQARAVLVQALIESGQIEAADNLLQALPHASAPGIDRLRGRVLMARSAHAEAEVILRKQLAKSPEDSATRWDLAMCVRELGRVEEGATILEEAALSDHATAEDWSLLARYYASDDLALTLESGARAALRSLLLDPNHAESLLTLAHIRELQDDTAAALAVVRRYTDVRENDADAWHRRARLELATGGRWTDALASVDQACAISADSAYRALRGFIHAGLENYADAIEDLEEAEADSSVTSIQFDLTLAECYVRTEAFEQAEHRMAAVERKINRAGIAVPDTFMELKNAITARGDVE
jgi:predicted Zn-dependent protease